ncbi:MAG: hypothetical protein EKK45_00600 [Curvibacter sp.]|nr:MAG: hypothetical protein EKK45_00600 [Curvibacter sp.]
MKLFNGVLFLIIIAQLLLALYQYRRHRRLKMHQQRLVESLAGVRYWRVGMARVEFLKTWPKLGPQQALGVLIDDGDTLRLRGRWHGAQEDVEKVIRKDSVGLTWIPPHPFRTANLAWLRLDDPTGSLLICAETLPQPKASREALADLAKAVFPHFRLPQGAATEFSLEKNRYSLTAMLLFLALAAFSLLDTYVFNPYELIESQVAKLLVNPLVALSALIVLAGVGFFSYRRLMAGQVPAQESVVLTVFLTASLAMAALPALKRVDQALAPEGSTWYRYRLVDRVVHFSPVDARQGLPTLRFTKAPEYWAQMEVGSEVQIPLLRGPLGLWQLDHQRFDPPILKFYESSNAK